jgi:SanA protein
MSGSRRRRAALVAVPLVALALTGAAIEGVGAQMEARVHDRVFSVDDAPARETAIVLGAKPGPLLSQRMDAACLLVEKRKVMRLVLSGLPEEMPVMRERARACLDDAAILVDDGATRTLENLRRARDRFGVRELLVVTQEFHLPRALYLADALGLDALGVRALGAPRSLAGRWRERLARMRAVVDVRMLP